MQRLPALGARPAFRRTLVVLVAAALCASVVILSRAPEPAGADSTQNDVDSTCQTIFGPTDVDIPTTVVDTPDPVVAGQQMTIAYTTSYPSIVTSSQIINSVQQTWPMPPQVASVDGVSFSGGHANFDSTWDNPSSDDEVIVTFTADPPTSNRPPTPTVTVTVTIDAGAGGQTIEWLPFSNQTSDVTFVGTDLVATCTPDDPDQVLNETEVQAGGTTTTTSSTTTSSTSTTTTTAPPAPSTCTQVASADGWTKNIGVGPGGLTFSNGTSNKMYTTFDGLSYFRSFLKFAGAGGSCAEGGTMPSGVTVTDIDLSLVKTDNCICNGPVQQVYRVTSSWSEGNLHPNGGPSVAGSTSHTFNTPAKDTAFSTSSAGMIADVQGWIDGSVANHGWSLRQRYNGSGDTGNAATPAGWGTREHATSSYRPTLTITYQ